MPERIDKQEMASFLWSRVREGLAIITKEGIIKKANPALCRMLGYASSELEGKHFGEITASMDLEADNREFTRLVSGEIERYTMDKMYITKRGSTIMGRLEVSRFLDDFLMFGQVLPTDPVMEETMTDEQRIFLLEQAVGHTLRKHWKGILIGLLALIGLVAGVINIADIFSLFGITLGNGG